MTDKQIQLLRRSIEENLTSYALESFDALVEELRLGREVIDTARALKVEGWFSNLKLLSDAIEAYDAATKEVKWAT